MCVECVLMFEYDETSVMRCAVYEPVEVAIDFREVGIHVASQHSEKSLRSGMNLRLLAKLVLTGGGKWLEVAHSRGRSSVVEHLLPKGSALRNYPVR